MVSRCKLYSLKREKKHFTKYHNKFWIKIDNLVLTLLLIEEGGGTQVFVIYVFTKKLSLRQYLIPTCKFLRYIFTMQN